jgi:DNA-binding PadR family transcriptional regulator
MLVVEGTLYPLLTRLKNAATLTTDGRNPPRVRPASITP